MSDASATFDRLDVRGDGAITLLVEDRGSLAALREAAPAAERAGLRFLIRGTEGAPRAEVAAMRKQLGAAPLGFVALDERRALDAIAAGADEALMLVDHGPAAVLAFLHRTRLRAHARVRQETLQISLVQADRLSALGTVVAGVGHEINNPAAAMTMSLDLLKMMIRPVAEVIDAVERAAASGRGLSTHELGTLAELARSGGPWDEVFDVLDEMSGAMRTITNVVKDLRVFSRANDEEAPELVDLHALIDQVVRLVRGELPANAHVERDFCAGLGPVLLPRSRIAQVLTNVIVNAAHAMGEVERPVHRLRISTRSDDDGVVVSISDTGPGIAPEAFDRIFDPFYTTKPVGVGTGLGLAVSREIMRNIGGDLLAESGWGKGATFALLVPRLDADRTASERPPPKRVSAVATKRVPVLLVDDDERVLRACARALREHYDVLLACDGSEAIELLQSGSQASVVVTDMAMPEIDGRKLHGWLEANRPELAVRTVFVTGGARCAETEAFLSAAGRVVLHKPITLAALLAAVAERLQAPLPADMPAPAAPSPEAVALARPSPPYVALASGAPRGRQSAPS